jgi:hypothetical protein
MCVCKHKKITKTLHWTWLQRGPQEISYPHVCSAQEFFSHTPSLGHHMKLGFIVNTYSSILIVIYSTMRVDSGVEIVATRGRSLWYQRETGECHRCFVEKCCQSCLVAQFTCQQTIKIEEYVMTSSAGSSTLEFSRNSVAGEFRTGSEPKLQKRRHHSASNVQSVLQKKIPCRPDKCDADILK